MFAWGSRGSEVGQQARSHRGYKMVKWAQPAGTRAPMCKHYALPPCVTFPGLQYHDHNLGRSKQQKGILLQFWWEALWESVRRTTTPWRFWGEPFLPLPRVCWPRHILVCGSTTPHSPPIPHGQRLLVYLYPHWCSSPYVSSLHPMRTPKMCGEDHPVSVQSHRNLITSTKTLFPKRHLHRNWR